MKHLNFKGNRVEDAAMAFIDVLKYSDQSVDYPDFNDIEPWPEEVIELFKKAVRNAHFSEQTAIIMYTQQAVEYDSIAELMLGVSLVEMQHLDKVKDFLRKANPNPGNIIKIEALDIDYGKDPKEALRLAIQSEKKTLYHYHQIKELIELKYPERADSDDVIYFLNKLIADEERHLKLFEEAMGTGTKESKGVTVIIK